MKVTQEMLDKIFNKPSQDCLYEKCKRKSSGTIGVVCEDIEVAERILSDIMLDYNDDEIKRTVVSRSKCELELTNGDIFQWIPPHSGSKGIKLKGVIFDPEFEIDKMFFDTVLIPMCIHCSKDTAEIYVCF